MRRAVLALIFGVGMAFAACSSEEPGAGGGDAGTGGTPARDASVTADGSKPAPDGSAGAAASFGVAASAPAEDAAVSDLTVTSAAFTAGAFIPDVHSCDGAGASIPLAWTGAPNGTQSYAVVMRDLSLPGTGNYHWVLWDIPATTTSLPQGIAKQASPPTPAGSKQTAWSFGPSVGYGHMCPPSGTTHDYELSVYAFSVTNLPPAGDPSSPNQVDAIIQTYKTAAGSIVGKYTRP